MIPNKNLNAFDFRVKFQIICIISNKSQNDFPNEEWRVQNFKQDYGCYPEI